jgi:hypothetical protein
VRQAPQNGRRKSEVKIRECIYCGFDHALNSLSVHGAGRSRRDRRCVQRRGDWRRALAWPVPLLLSLLPRRCACRRCCTICADVADRRTDSLSRGLRFWHRAAAPTPAVYIYASSSSSSSSSLSLLSLLSLLAVSKGLGCVGFKCKLFNEHSRCARFAPPSTWSL